MCGRYYVDEETAKEIRRLVLKLDQRFQEKSDQNMARKMDWNMAREMNRNIVREAERKLDAGAFYGAAGGTAAVFPSQKAAVIMGRERHLEAEQMLWGFPRFDGRGLLINARAETAAERRTFRESILHRRCVIPAKGFWEWNKSKEKFSFERPDAQVMFMAGCYDCFDGQERFVILTTEANPSVKPVHDRMPLILERNELEDWVTDDGATEHFLHKTPVLLEREAEYEQMSLF
ncbi:MAG TPA: SOS response-associated peptidase [Candidatus Mediterraneibacter tabaqchaliae]|uniref:Abasic site processing protein n=1 Tax=Candidatus Mediterraneibacter tabaqchaliae TaxID=2838689 RepID=A0A9D2R5M4_9FIRM|nr:SOS response-associated peptidase [Candidatus Mediterraneibacter tabaqchaliae]